MRVDLAIEKERAKLAKCGIVLSENPHWLSGRILFPI